MTSPYPREDKYQILKRLAQKFLRWSLNWTTHDRRGQTIGHLSDLSDLIIKQRLWIFKRHALYPPLSVAIFCTLFLLGLFYLLAASGRYTYWMQSLKYISNEKYFSLPNSFYKKIHGSGFINWYIMLIPVYRISQQQ